MKTVKLLIIAALPIFTACNNDSNEPDAYGNFETRETIVSAEANGKVIKLNIEEGQEIKVGQEIGLIDTTQLALSLQQALAQQQAAKSKLATIDANADVFRSQKESIKIEYDRIKKLIKDNAATQQKLDDIKGRLDVVGNQIKSAVVQKNSVNAELAAVGAQIAMIKDQLRKCHIINPINGTVLEKYVEPYELVGAGKSLYKIADISSLDLRVYVSGDQLSHIKLGQKAKVFIDESKKENRELEGEITWVSPKAEFTPKIIQTKQERVNLVYAVKVNVPNDGSLKIGMPGEIKF